MPRRNDRQMYHSIVGLGPWQEGCEPLTSKRKVINLRTVLKPALSNEKETLENLKSATDCICFPVCSKFSRWPLGGAAEPRPGRGPLKVATDQELHELGRGGEHLSAVAPHLEHRADGGPAAAVSRTKLREETSCCSSCQVVKKHFRRIFMCSDIRLIFK